MATLVGWFRMRRRLADVSAKIERGGQYGVYLRRYWDSSGSDHEAYYHLVEHSPQIQIDLGSQGIISYKPPAANYYIHNYPIVVNLVPELEHWIEQRDLFSTLDPALHMVRMLRDTLVRHLGVLETRQRELRRQLRKPLVLLREGLQWTLFLPFDLLADLGVLTHGVVSTVRHSWFGRLIAGLIAALAFLSVVTSLVTGWDDFVRTIREWLGW